MLYARKKILHFSVKHNSMEHMAMRSVKPVLHGWRRKSLKMCKREECELWAIDAFVSNRSDEMFVLKKYRSKK